MNVPHIDPAVVFIRLSISCAFTKKLRHCRMSPNHPPHGPAAAIGSLLSKVLSWNEMPMADNEDPSDPVRSAMARNLEQARLAMNNYFHFVEKSMSASPLGATDQAKTFRSYVERTVAANFDLSDRLLHAEDFQDIVRIQTDFFQAQLRALTEQTRELDETVVQATSNITRIPIK